MKNGMRAICSTLSLGLALLAAGCSGGKEKNTTRNLEEVRAKLREQVASGALTLEEAQVRLAVATKESRFKGKPKQSPALEALGAQLQEQVKKGELTSEEAKAKFAEAKTKTPAKAGNKKEESK